MFAAVVSYFLLLIQKVIPVKKGRFVFTSFNGHYSDNPKYISQKLHEIDPSSDIVWLVKRQYMSELPSYVKAVDIDSPRAVFWQRARAAVFVDNVYAGQEDTLSSKNRFSRLKFRIRSFLKNKKTRKVFTTWHGTPLKCMGRDQLNSHVLDFSCPQTTMLMGNQYTLDIMQHLTFDKIKMVLCGTPRNDPLFLPQADRDVLKEQLGLPVNKKVVLFAPTFRNDGNDIANTNVQRSGLNQLDSMEFDKLFDVLSERFGGEWVMVCRFHYHVEALVDWDGLQQRYPDKIINGNAHDDMAQYLACADVLLTDASSSMYDFALTQKPCFLFFPDVEYYSHTERGFYTPIDDLPFPMADTFAGLLQTISEFDAKLYRQKVTAMLSDYGYVDDETSSERVARHILAQITV